jgi:hypothetical protein
MHHLPVLANGGPGGSPAAGGVSASASSLSRYRAFTRLRPPWSDLIPLGKRLCRAPAWRR